MNLSYSDEQNMLREQVLKFCESDYTFDVREKLLNRTMVIIQKLGNNLQTLDGWQCLSVKKMVVLILVQLS